jgi:hypothetical protein
LALGLLKKIVIRDQFHRFAFYLLALGVLTFFFL